MTNIKYRVVFALSAFLVVGLSWVRAQDCGEIAGVASMARAKSMRALAEASKRAGDGYRARLVFAYRSFHLHPGGKSEAEKLLALIPADDAQEEVVLTLGGSLCDQEPLADMETLGRVRDGFGRELAKAVLLAPSFLPSYVEYSTVAVLDPHSDYALQMKIVCRQAHADFVRAVKRFPERKRQLFAKQVMNPDSCKPLALPEAEP